MNSLTQKPDETKKVIAVGQIQAEMICHADHDVTSSFKVKRESHTNCDSRNEFPDLKTLRNNNKIIAVGQIQAEITRSRRPTM